MGEYENMDFNKTRSALLSLPLILVLLLGLAPLCVQAQQYNLVSGNSTASINPSSVVGIDGWTIDGINQLASQWWYYRIGDTQQQPLNAMATAQVTQATPNVLDVLFSGSQVDVSLRYILTGGTPGSGNSTIAEMVRVRNKTSQPIDFHLFEFTDLNLNDTPGDDNAALLNPTTIGQWDGALITTESASTGGMTPVPDRWEIANAFDLFNKLNNAPVADLANMTSPLSGDVAFAFQWLLEIPAGQTQVLSKSKILKRGGAIGDYVWFDLNGNGIQDEDESGIADVTVILEADFNGDGIIDFTDSMETDESGFYLFPNLPPGTYRITVDSDTLPDGLIQTYDLDGIESPDTAVVILRSGEVNLNVDFGYFQYGSIGDRVWNDLNADGVQNENEPGIGGVTVTLYDEEGNVLATTVTTDDGGYLFEFLPPGTYTVCVDAATLPADLVQTYDLDGELDHCTTVDLEGSQDRTDVDFGYTGGSSSIRLIKTGPESSQVGSTITYTFKVINTGNTTLRNVTVTDPLLGGVIWQKSSMAPGETVVFTKTYKITQNALTSAGVGDQAKSGTISAQCCFFYPWPCLPKPTCNPKPPCKPKNKLVNTATVVGFDSKNGKVTDQSSCTTTVGPALGSIGDRVWHDYNKNGVQDAGEPGINGVKLTLKDSSGKTIATATTSGDGKYLFSGLGAGTYKVMVNTSSLPKNMTQTYELDKSLNGSTTVSLSAGQNRVDVDFGYVGKKPGICLAKTGPSKAAVNSTITYHFKVTNTGNTCLYNVSLNDPLLGGIIWKKASMAPGEVCEFDKTYVVKSIPSGSGGCGSYCTTPSNPPSSGSGVLVNQATVSACPPSGCKVTCTSSCKTTITKATTTSCYTTFNQKGWGSAPSNDNGGAMLKENFNKIYPCGKVTIGGINKVSFTSADKIRCFLPQSGKVGLLKGCGTNVSSTAAGEFAGNVLALKLNVDFSNAGVTCKGLGNLKLSNTALKGWSISQVLSLAQSVLGGNTCALPWGVSVSQVNSIVAGINDLYDGG